MHEIHTKGMVMSEAFQVATIIEKLLSGGRISKVTLSTRERKGHKKT